MRQLLHSNQAATATDKFFQFFRRRHFHAANRRHDDHGICGTADSDPAVLHLSCLQRLRIQMVIVQLLAAKLLADLHPFLPDPCTCFFFLRRFALIPVAGKSISVHTPQCRRRIHDRNGNVRLCVADKHTQTACIVAQLPVMLPIRVLQKLGRRRVMLRDILNGIVKGMKYIEIDAVAAETVQHPPGILKRHAPANTVEAFDHGIFSVVLSRQRADGLLTAAEVTDAVVIDPVQRLSQLFMAGIPTDDGAACLCRSADRGHFSGIKQIMVIAPVRHLLMKALIEEMVYHIIQIIADSCRIREFAVIQGRKHRQKIIALPLPECRRKTL